MCSTGDPMQKNSYRKNDHNGNIINSCPGIKLTPLFWLCECDTSYVHPAKQKYCLACNMYRDECPDADVEIVLKNAIALSRNKADIDRLVNVLKQNPELLQEFFEDMLSEEVVVSISGILLSSFLADLVTEGKISLIGLDTDNIIQGIKDKFWDESIKDYFKCLIVEMVC
jgi:hypothetical protein